MIIMESQGVEAGFPEEAIRKPSRERQPKVNDASSREKIGCDSPSYQVDACVFSSDGLIRSRADLEASQ